MDGAVTALSDWLHKLPASQVQALREFRAAARLAYPDDFAPLARAIDTAPPLILKMPREYVLALDH